MNEYDFGARSYDLQPEILKRSLGKIGEEGIPNKLETYQEINRTLYDGDYKMNYRIETGNKLGNYTGGDNPPRSA